MDVLTFKFIGKNIIILRLAAFKFLFKKLMAEKTPRRSYTREFKMEVIKKSKEIKNNREVVRMFCIAESCARKWVKTESLLNLIPSSKRARRHGILHWPELEEELKNWVMIMRQNERKISTPSEIVSIINGNIVFLFFDSIEASLELIFSSDSLEPIPTALWSPFLMHSGLTLDQLSMIHLLISV